MTILQSNIESINRAIDYQDTSNFSILLLENPETRKYSEQSFNQFIDAKQIPISEFIQKHKNKEIINYLQESKPTIILVDCCNVTAQDIVDLDAINLKTHHTNVFYLLMCDVKSKTLLREMKQWEYRLSGFDSLDQEIIKYGKYLELNKKIANSQHIESTHHKI